MNAVGTSAKVLCRLPAGISDQASPIADLVERIDEAAGRRGAI
jgi:hypothetical protein